MTMRMRLAVATLAMMVLCSCGYQLATEKGIIKGEVVAVDIPVFKNRTYEPQMPMFFTEMFTQELVTSGLFDVNRKDADSTLQGTITNVRTIISALSTQGLAVQKTVEVTIELLLSKKTGSQVRRWTLTDAEAYAISDVNLEDFNRREALKRIAGRMARRFTSMVFSEY